MIPRQRNKLGLKLVVYYATLVAFVALLVRLFPQVIPLLPFGGLEALQQREDLVTETDLVNLITQVRIPLDLLADGISITLSMLGALLLMIPVRWVYMAVGLAAGTQALGIALALSVLFVFTALVLEPLVAENPPSQSVEDQGPTD